MLKNAAKLSDTSEYFIVWAGGTGARPWGTKADAYRMFPELELARDGAAYLGDFSGGGHNAASTTTFTATTSVAVAANEWVGARLRMGANNGPALGYGTIVSNTAVAGAGTFTITLTWTIGLDAGAGSTSDAFYVVRENRKWGSYPQVRVLTPHQAVPRDDSTTNTALSLVPGGAFASEGCSLTLPAPYNGATGATAFDDIGVLLPLSFFEGIDGYGISETGDSENPATAHPITGIASAVWTFSNALGFEDLLNGGYVLVDWETGGVTKRSWAPITDSTTTTFTVGTWLGDGDPTTHTNVKRYTAWIPHFNDSPHAYLPGEGFSYPNHDPLPCARSAIGANIHNRPRGLTGNAYQDSFGALLVAAMKVSAATGKRVNIVNLSATDALLAPSSDRNPYGFPGQLGWWDQEDTATWNPADSTALYARLDKLLRTVLPNAMTAEGNTKTLKCLGVVFAAGDADALDVRARQNYGAAQRLLVSVLRRLIGDLGYSPYENGALLPFVHPRIPFLPYSIDGTYARHAGRGGGTMVYDADIRGRVNSAIEENTVADEFATAVRVDDLPRDDTDPGLYSGVGEAELGARIGDALTSLIDYGLGFGSATLATPQTRLIDICNLALAHIGDAKQIASLSEGSEQALLCRRFLPEARDELLQSRPWGFATRRRQLVPIAMPEARIFEYWAHCYVVPAEAVFSFKVLPPAVEASAASFDYTDVLEAAYESTFVTNSGSVSTGTTGTPSPVGHNPSGAWAGVVMESAPLLPVVAESEQEPQPFLVEQSPYGHRYLFTNQPQATLQYAARVVDADLYSPLFASALAANLASKLAPVLIKGQEGEMVSARLLAKTAGYANAAASADANQQRLTEADRPYGFVPDHMRHRI